MDVLNTVKALWDRLGAALAITAGALCLLFGWLGVRSTAYVAEQIPYVLTGGVLGIFFLGIGVTLWLSSDLRDQWRALLDLRRSLEDGRIRLVDESELEKMLQNQPSANGSKSSTTARRQSTQKA
ncbi:MAG: hypothetical protein QOJ03_3173 [Frankiaceae bacterium]|jgi:hypothetical protein|nr:hypothetical protein [Frankiaceae bacterium]